jgi:hypothetical protein
MFPHLESLFVPDIQPSRSAIKDDSRACVQIRCSEKVNRESSQYPLAIFLADQVSSVDMLDFATQFLPVKFIGATEASGR